MTDSSNARPPPLTQSDAVNSLLSLGSTAAAAAVITADEMATTPVSSTDSTSTSVPTEPVGLSQTTITTSTTTTTTTTTSTGLNSTNGPGTSNTATTGKHHRRLSSTGKSRRRLSDAREASTRPLTQHSLLSLASLSLSTSPGALSSKPLAPRLTSQSTTTTASGISISSNSTTTPVAIPIVSSASISLSIDPSDKDMSTSGGSTPIPITTNGRQKKRGVDYKCESCAKIYRHPNCLNKHRWEHTRQWREASKFVLSKHQQVQLLEAAAILSYMGTSSTSLPEDRSEWPSFLSGGSLPKPDAESKPITADYSNLSTSVPIRTHHRPRMHDFTLNSGALGIGVVGPPNETSMPVAHKPTNTDLPSWTIPSSSIRSESSASGSGSRSRSGSSRSRSDASAVDGELEVEEEDEEYVVDVEIMDADADTIEDDDHRLLIVQDSMSRTRIMAADKPYHRHYHHHQMEGIHDSTDEYYAHGREETIYGSPTANGRPGSYRRPSSNRSHVYYAATPDRNAGYAERIGGGAKTNNNINKTPILMKKEMPAAVENLRGEDAVMTTTTTTMTMMTNDKRYSERRWDGMEMEVDMDMD